MTGSRFDRWFDRRLGFVSRGDPNSGIFLILVLLLATQVVGGHRLPETRQIVAVLASFVIAVTIHEFMHAYTALQLGDTTARDLGRISLNPVVHFEPFGFFGMVMISLGYSFIGWGKPVPVNPSRLRGGIVKGQRAMAIVAIAGPISNVVQAGLAAIPLRLAARNGQDLGDLGYFLSWFLWVNLLLAAFNMIPIPPLDGHKVLLGLLPNFWYPILAPMERYGFMILFAVFYLGNRITDVSISDAMISPVFDLLRRIIVGSSLRL